MKITLDQPEEKIDIHIMVSKKGEISKTVLQVTASDEKELNQAFDKIRENVKFDLKKDKS